MAAARTTPTGDRPPRSTDRVLAVVSPRSKGPTSLFDAPSPITQQNVGQYTSDRDVLQAAARELTQIGFEVLNIGDATISIAGRPEQFESVFGAKLERQHMERSASKDSVDYFRSAEGPESYMLPPDRLSGIIEGVAIAEPPDYYEAALPPLVEAAANTYRYLFVPNEIGMLLNAERIHRMGTTGKGVPVAMIDSGHYAHTFFNRYGFRVSPTVLGPGSSDPSNDMSGHGTGESANIFATAPDATLIPIKMAADSTGAFNAAIAQNPKVISCSWGYNIDQPGATLSAYLKTLEAAVALAVSKGITVVFAAGNGHFSFPASHPDVLAVGGVHVNYPALTFEASSYASSFNSSLYPGRAVPDVCGLVGKNVGGTAPLVMLPVQPGASLDTGNTGSGTDGWGIFSGTSAACPQVAGIVALLIQKKPTLQPKDVKKILVDSAIDVKAGSTAMGHAAGNGPDLATGAGLANAKWAWLITMGGLTAEFFSAAPEIQHTMVNEGTMPPLTQELINEMISTLRSRV